MSIGIWLDRGVCLVEPSGELDDGQASKLREALFEALRLSRGATILIVEDQITALTPRAQRVIEFYALACRERSGALAVVSTDGALHQAGRLSALGIVNREFGDLDEALTQLSGLGPDL